MAVEEYFDNLFKTACGWLGWVPEVVLTSTIAQLELALEGKIDFIKKTNPFRTKEDEEKEEEEKTFFEADSNPEIAAQRIISMVRQRQASITRGRVRRKKRVVGEEVILSGGGGKK